MLTVLSLTVSLCLRPLVISFPSLNHFTFSSGLPLIVHSSVADSPAVTLIEAAGSMILAGSGIQTDLLAFRRRKEKRISTALKTPADLAQSKSLPIFADQLHSQLGTNICHRG